MTMIPAVSDRIRAEPTWRRHLSARTALGWLAAGWRDLWQNPGPSLAYGLLVALVSVAIVFGLFSLGWDYILLPALAGFLVAGPVLAIGHRPCHQKPGKCWRLGFMKKADSQRVVRW